VFEKHLNLDVQLYPLIKHLLKTEQTNRAIHLVKSQIMSVEAGRNLTDMFDECGQRALAIELEYFFDEKQKEAEYEAIQELGLQELRAKAPLAVKQHSNNPMNPKFRKPHREVIPFTIASQSVISLLLQSQNSAFADDVSQRSQ
jgi:hypothetical protein